MGHRERVKEEDGQTGRVEEMSGPNTRVPHVGSESRFVWTQTRSETKFRDLKIPIWKYRDLGDTSRQVQGPSVNFPP
jgi:hypothetical protein